MPIQIPIHPMLIHFPIALLFAGFLADLLGILLKKEWLAHAAFFLLVLGALGAVSAVITGHHEADKVLRTPAINSALEEHEEDGETTMWFFLALGAARFLLVWRKLFRPALRWLFLAAWLVGLAFLTETGWHGGHLVFEYGAGVSTSPPAAASPAAPDTDDD